MGEFSCYKNITYILYCSLKYSQRYLNIFSVGYILNVLACHTILLVLSSKPFNRNVLPKEYSIATVALFFLER